MFSIWDRAFFTYHFSQSLNNLFSIFTLLVIIMNLTNVQFGDFLDEIQAYKLQEFWNHDEDTIRD